MDLLSVLNTDRVSVVSVCEVHGADAGFVSNQLLGKYLASHASCILLTLHHTFGHYHNVGVRLGHNLLKKRHDNCLVVFDSPNQDLPSLLDQIRTKIKDLPKPYLVFVDDLSDLISVGNTYRDTAVFWHSLRALVTNDSGVLITGVHAYNDEPSPTLAAVLSHNSDLTLVTEPLKTGYCREAHGRLIIRNGVVPAQEYLYKVEEKGGKLFPL